MIFVTFRISFQHAVLALLTVVSPPSAVSILSKLSCLSRPPGLAVPDQGLFLSGTLELDPSPMDTARASASNGSKQVWPKSPFSPKNAVHNRPFYAFPSH